jgi:hypothetical protein
MSVEYLEISAVGVGSLGQSYGLATFADVGRNEHRWIFSPYCVRFGSKAVIQRGWRDRWALKFALGGKRTLAMGV